MKHILSFTVLFHLSQLVLAQNDDKMQSCKTGIPVNNKFPVAKALDSIMKHHTAAGIPGAAVAVYSATDGWWEGAAGYSTLEDKSAMQPCHLQYLQSISKTYLAVAILQLKEKGRINIDAPMNQYLPAIYQQYIQGAEKLTIRMLLNHTTGIPDYGEEPGFAARVLEQPLKTFSREEALSFINKQALLFTPGSKFSYSNTNYLLLSLIADAITGDHTVFIKKNIFDPLGLQNSFYGNDYNYIPRKRVTGSYWDVFGNGRVVNVSKMQQVNVSCIKGDDGIVCTPADVVRFLKGLMEGKLLSAASLTEMKTWINDGAGNPTHGMGLFHFKFGDTIAYGHGGGGIGAGCVVLYFPEQDKYAFLAVNLGMVLAATPLMHKVEELKTAILMALLQ